MASLYLLIPIAIIFVCIAVAIFLWAVKSEQFEDLERQGYDILFDENDENSNPKQENASKSQQPPVDKS
ncbi:cytochrome C oxidase Cbb3 [Photobacterium jeanii]|uniref:Cytochrome C oxidase Cbb3 n=1 Tax=Photobacterium jeanii TaxID=858640 RepID=A0A178KKZ4_9GAMM|nr:cbb3-type cytochrome oxidase assembly protein CcoS [Photobacterium jeanii]OAN17900.1 cytochrome C oxidase Cbb3 [Photobacterium jeanii]PST92433.1 cbb3-type cytochrome oxidase assembly protein CcoS [Photobacterium jeanii]